MRRTTIIVYCIQREKEVLVVMMFGEAEEIERECESRREIHTYTQKTDSEEGKKKF